MRHSFGTRASLVRSPTEASPELRLLFHRLNNQLGTVIAHAELLEAKASDDVSRARSTQVITSVLDAMATAKEIRSHVTPHPLADETES
ncbi:MAG: hypothetical protein C5B57_09675 [Blastocatellia bacterium]|nr:MAG: hypothetical protein C5B57_09675 [Blastocatellia bacterium]